MRTGKAIEKFEIDMTTHRGIKVRKTGCAYPIFKTGRAIAAIEFGDFFYDRNHIGDIEGHSEHMDTLKQKSVSHWADGLLFSILLFFCGDHSAGAVDSECLSSKFWFYIP